MVVCDCVAVEEWIILLLSAKVLLEQGLCAVVSVAIVLALFLCTTLTVEEKIAGGKLINCHALLAPSVWLHKISQMHGKNARPKPYGK